MIRKALIIYCDDTTSGPLAGPLEDNSNFRAFMTSPLGGNWKSEEILSLANPTKAEVNNAVSSFMNNADYTFTIFTGHGYISVDDKGRQYVELKDDSIPIANIRTSAVRQTMIVDACRGFYKELDLLRGIVETFSSSDNSILDTRKIFDKSVMKAEKGITVLYAASKNETALDTNQGAAYLLSLLEVAKLWGENDNQKNILPINVAHKRAIKYLKDNFDTIQNPSQNPEKRINHFPFAVKYKLIDS